MTYNTHHGVGNNDGGASSTADIEISCNEHMHNLSRLADVILAESPEIVALQELDRFWTRSGVVDQPAELANRLSMKHDFGANLVLESDEPAGIQREYGVGTFSEHRIISCEHILLPTMDGWEQRGMLDTHIEVPGIGEIVVINIHLQSNTKGMTGEAARQRASQSQAIADYISRLELPVIVLGDLNSEPDSTEVSALLGENSGLTDVWNAVGEGTGETIFNGAHGEPTARIDYILVSSHFTIHSAEVIDTDNSQMASDHFPLIADLGIRT